MTLRTLRKVGTKPGVHPILVKQSKYRKSPILLSYKQKQYVIGCLVLFNAILAGLTLNSSPALRMQNLQSVEAAMTATPTVTPATQISTVTAPETVTSQVTAEKVAATPTPTPKSAVAGVSISRPASTSGNWDGLLQTYFGSAWQAAKRVMMCESSGNPNAINRSSGATGLMQIMPLPGRPSQQALLNPETNIATAAKIYHAQGWKPWVCQP